MITLSAAVDLYRTLHPGLLQHTGEGHAAARWAGRRRVSVVGAGTG